MGCDKASKGNGPWDLLCLLGGGVGVSELGPQRLNGWTRLAYRTHRPRPDPQLGTVVLPRAHNDLDRLVANSQSYVSVQIANDL